MPKTLFDSFESLRAGLKSRTKMDNYDMVTLRIGYFAGLQTMLKRLSEDATPEELRQELADLQADIEADVRIEPEED